jgi:hypothetical protein
MKAGSPSPRVGQLHRHGRSQGQAAKRNLFAYRNAMTGNPGGNHQRREAAGLEGQIGVIRRAFADIAIDGGRRRTSVPSSG